MEFKGGLYASQVTANSPKKALEQWAKTKLSSYSELVGVNITGELVEEISKETVVALEGLKNAWCRSFLIENDLAVVNLTQTVE
jgi:hypothetical protein